MDDGMKELTERMKALTENVGHALGIMSKQIDDLTQKVESLSETVDLPSAKCTGHWILCENQRQEDVDNGNYLFVCSECGFVDVHSKAVTVSFCWNCGADMRGENK